MTLYIKKGSLVEDVQKLFAVHYPFLKIEFYKKQPALNLPLAAKAYNALKHPLIHFTNLPDKTVIDIDENITVAELEDKFDSLGLKAEIFRRSGNVWVETSLTDNWTLKQQNLEAEEISRHFDAT